MAQGGGREVASAEQRRQEHLERLAAARDRQKKGFPIITFALVFISLVALIIFFDWLLLRL